MLRSIMVGLDGSKASQTAVELGIRWALRHDALLVGIGIIDEPTIAKSKPALLGGPPHADPLVYRERMADARRQVEQFLERFSVRCAEAAVASKVLEDVGLPWKEIIREAQRFDLILLGSPTHFHFETEVRRDDTLETVLRNSPRPLVVVPETAANETGTSVVVAYDGSVQAARALQAFQASGLGKGKRVHVITVHSDSREAARLADRANDYLRSHEIDAQAHALESSARPSDLLLEQARALGAELIVMGSYGKSALHDFLLGSVTRRLLTSSTVPLFLEH